MPGGPVAGARLAGGYAAGAAATLFWGLSFVGVRVAVETFRPVALVGLRLAIASALLFGVAALRGGPLRPRAG